MILYETHNTRITLGQEVASGSNATLYEVIGEPTLLAKQYTSSSDDYEAKLICMMAHPFDPAQANKVPYTPPELQGQHSSELVRSTAHDNFVLGVLIFLFVREHQQPSQRPSATEWKQALAIAEQALFDCGEGDFYDRRLQHCRACRHKPDLLTPSAPPQGRHKTFWLRAVLMIRNHD